MKVRNETDKISELLKEGRIAWGSPYSGVAESGEAYTIDIPAFDAHESLEKNLTRAERHIYLDLHYLRARAGALKSNQTYTREKRSAAAHKGWQKRRERL